MQLKTNNSVVAYSADDTNFTVTAWSKLPPTKADLIAAGATLVKYDRKFTDKGVTPNSYIHDVLFTLTPAYEAGKMVSANRPHDTNVKLVHAVWAKRLFVIKYNFGSKYGYEYVRIATIAQNRADNKLYMFAANGQPFKMLPTRKHITPKYVAAQIGGDIDCFRIDCVQCDKIAKAAKHGKTRDRRYVPDKPAGLSGYDIRNGATKHQQTYCDDDHDMLDMPPAYYQISETYKQLKDSIVFDPTNFASIDEQIAFVMNAIEDKYNVRYQRVQKATKK